MLNNFLKQYNKKGDNMLPVNKFDQFTLILSVIGLFLSVGLIAFSQIKIILLCAWILFMASLGMIFKLLGF